MNVAPVLTRVPSSFAAIRTPGSELADVPGVAGGPDGLPATDVARRVGRDLLQVSGATNLSWGSRDPSTLFVEFGDEASARIAAGLFEPTIDDVRIVARVGDTIVTAPDHESPASAADRVRAVGAMRGIWDARYAQTSQYEHGRVTFAAVDQDTVDRLDAILRDRISFGWMPETGVTRFLYLRFTVDLPGSDGTGGSSSSAS